MGSGAIGGVDDVSGAAATAAAAADDPAVASQANLNWLLAGSKPDRAQAFLDSVKSAPNARAQINWVLMRGGQLHVTDAQRQALKDGFKSLPAPAKPADPMDALMKLLPAAGIPLPPETGTPASYDMARTQVDGLKGLQPNEAAALKNALGNWRDRPGDASDAEQIVRTAQQANGTVSPELHGRIAARFGAAPSAATWAAQIRDRAADFQGTDKQKQQAVRAAVQQWTDYLKSDELDFDKRKVPEPAGMTPQERRALSESPMPPAAGMKANLLAALSRLAPADAPPSPGDVQKMIDGLKSGAPDAQERAVGTINGLRDWMVGMEHLIQTNPPKPAVGNDDYDRVNQLAQLLRPYGEHGTPDARNAIPASLRASVSALQRDLSAISAAGYGDGITGIKMGDLDAKGNARPRDDMGVPLN